MTHDNGMSYEDIRRARRQAQQQIDIADQAVKGAVALAAGRLKTAGVPHWALCELKRELANYNRRTGEWKP